MKRYLTILLLTAMVVMVAGCQKVKVVEVTATPLVTRATVETKIPAVVASATPKPQATPTRTFTAVPTPTIAQTQTKIATATATLVPAATPTPTPFPTKTGLPWRWKVEVLVVGLPAEELRYLKFKFTDASGRELLQLGVQGDLYLLNGEPALVEAVGSEDGKHPWDGYWIKGDNNPKKVQVNVYTGSWTVKFEFGKK